MFTKKFYIHARLKRVVPFASLLIIGATFNFNNKLSFKAFKSAQDFKLSPFHQNENNGKSKTKKCSKNKGNKGKNKFYILH
mmetsp:Transcript_31982/g.63356  ORF Transcript_31982/g.63356 Transcript_31982/m.63356 type:complete len:81 (-) Transcript_31982:3807-4049(-)